MKQDIRELTKEELAKYFKEIEQPSYRADQVFRWFHVNLAKNLDELSNIPKSLKQNLSEDFYTELPQVIEQYESKIDGTKKYLLKLQDLECVECVLMEQSYGLSLCISTQVGCKMGCSFCASTIAGFKRNLTTSEMLSEVYTVQKLIDKRISHIVLMGIGEPLDNYDNVIKFIRMISSPDGLNISMRSITLSTCGIVPNMRKLKEECIPITLALSLHAPNDLLRKKIMKVAKQYTLEEILKQCQEYYKTTGRRVSYEYIIIKDVNSSKECAKELASLVKKYPGHINIIKLNKVDETGYESPSDIEIERFISILQQNGINATIRKSKGADINGACGQLRRKHEGEKD